tara:strand:+ start:255 stop:449 length:195 start_codon:yes stop_codon:yes gene_type:complete
MGCCCSTKTEKWSSPLLDIGDEDDVYRTEDDLVQPTPAPPNSPNDIITGRSDTPYSTAGNEFVI